MDILIMYLHQVLRALLLLEVTQLKFCVSVAEVGEEMVLQTLMATAAAVLAL
jgi:hypothetical protein